MLLIHSIFVVASILFSFFLSFTYSIRILHLLRKIDIISSNAYRSVVRMTQVFDLEKNVLFQKRCCNVSSEKMTLYYA